MDGITADRGLSPGTRTRFAVAAPEDDPAIRRLLRDNPMAGAIRLTFEREPDYFRGAGLAGAEDQTIVVFSKGRLVCVGRCSRRACWVDGLEADVGYLAELRLDAAARGRFALVRGGYRFFHGLQLACPVQLYFTSIAADNDRARRFLEKGARGMPEYRFLGELATVLVAVPRHPRPARLRLEYVTPETCPEWLRVLNGFGRRHQLATVWTEDGLRALEQRGMPRECCFLVRDGGEPVAGGALWDQRSFRQTVIRGYAPALAAIKPLVNAAARCFGTPRLPPVGETLSHAFLSPVAFASEAENLLPEVIAAAFPLARKIGLEHVTLALPADDPRLRVLKRRFSHRVYRSRLYRVGWPDEGFLEMTMTGRRFLPDVSLL